jgi:hypothetical protein
MSDDLSKILPIIAEFSLDTVINAIERNLVKVYNNSEEIIKQNRSNQALCIQVFKVCEILLTKTSEEQERILSVKDLVHQFLTKFPPEELK